jgi:hypothetical protein
MRQGSKPNKAAKQSSPKDLKKVVQEQVAIAEPI